jgi:hypothetical protein
MLENMGAGDILRARERESTRARLREKDGVKHESTVNKNGEGWG